MDVNIKILRWLLARYLVGNLSILSRDLSLYLPCTQGRSNAILGHLKSQGLIGSSKVRTNQTKYYLTRKGMDKALENFSV